jgi:transcriptional regulator with XRE-family HTH domain
MPRRNARLKSLRESVPLTQAELAERVGVAELTVRRWEAGLRPQPAHVRRLCTVLDASPAQLGYGPGDDPAATEPLPDDRRQAMRAIGRLASTSVTGAHLESLELDRQVEASDLGPATLEQLELTVERFGLEYLLTPPLEMFEAVRSCRLYVVDLLNGRHTLAERARLYGVAGWLSALLGHLAFDLGEGPSVAHSHSATALHLAAEADLDELTAWTRGTQAMIAVYAGHPEGAVAFCEAGRHVAPEGSATVVRLRAQQARAYARMGERASFERAMAAAETAFSDLSQEPTGSILSFDHPYLPFYAGTAYVWLKEPKLAQASAEAAIALCDGAPADWPVARVMARIDLAASLVQQGELEGAGRIGAEALEICASGRRTNPIAKRFAELLKSFKQSKGVFHDLEDQCRALLPAPR